MWRRSHFLFLLYNDGTTIALRTLSDVETKAVSLEDMETKIIY